MKYIITESRIKDAIVKFLDIHYVPDDGWRKKIIYDELNSYGYTDFWVNGDLPYSYFMRYPGRNPHTLELVKKMSDQLFSFFGNLWIPIFKDWFEQNTGLMVKEIYLMSKDPFKSEIIKLNESDNSFKRRYGVIKELIDESFDVLRDEVCEHAFSSFLSEVSFQVSDKMNYLEIPDGRDNARVIHKWVKDNFYDYIKYNFEKLLIEENCSESFDDYLNN